MVFKVGKYKHSEETKLKISKSKMGDIPWNKGLKGRLPNHNLNGLEKGRGWNKGLTKETDVRIKNMGLKISKSNKGKTPWNYLDGRSNNPKPRKQINGKMYSHIVWTSQPGNYWRVPEGCIIHHIDLNPDNNSPENLQLMEDIFHKKLHNQIFKMLKEQEVIAP